MTDSKERLILALDVPSAEQARGLVSQLEDLISFFKIGIGLYFNTGPDFVHWLLDRGMRVFLDLKYCDVEDTVRDAVGRVAKSGVSFLTVHGNSGIIRAAADGRGNSPLKLLSVTVLTCLDTADIQDLGFPCSVEELVLHRAQAALATGIDGVVASGQEAKAIRQRMGGNFIVVTPGIRPEGAEIGNHKRVVTPTGAIEAGADYLVVGKPIWKAQDPKQAAIKIIEEMDEAFSAIS